MAKKEATISWKQVSRLSLRGYRVLRKLCPRLLSAVFLSTAAEALSPYLTIWLSARVVNELAGQRRSDVLWPLVALTVAAIALTTLLRGVLDRWVTAKQEQYAVRKIWMFSEKFLGMDFADVDKTETSDLYSQIQQGENWHSWGLDTLIWGANHMTWGVMGILGAVVLTVSLFATPVPASAGGWTVLNHPLFLLATLAVLLAVSMLGPACETRAEGYWTRAGEESMLGNRLFTFFGFLGDDASKAMDRRMYNQRDIADYYETKDTAFSANGPIARFARGPMGLWGAMGSAGGVIVTAFIYVFVCLKAWAGAFGIGSVTQYVGAVAALTGSVSRLAEGLGQLKNNAPYLLNVFTFLDIPNKMYQGSLTTEKRADRKYQVEFKDVSFRYPGADSWALRHVSTKFTVGSRLAVVGENGSGKTTFIKLLCRLYDPQEGQILLNGIDIRKYRYDDYMGIFSVVFQDFKLLSQSLGSNVAGAKDFDRDKAARALRDAGFDTRLSTMPKGLDTMLYKDFDKEGVEVSGGEAQKIAIARALYKDAPFIILDEPTAALDPIAEAEIYSKFNDIVTDKTAIYISHRLSSCRFCDEIAVFDHGSIVQTGTHDSLVAASGKYQDLWNAQAQYYVEEK
ncbi:MAG: ABC transporter ATP-binding protein [Eubacteriales bacterium]|nr:ABC transporter ATP-binding protein [Eubacteriales bacterium]